MARAPKTAGNGKKFAFIALGIVAVIVAFGWMFRVRTTGPLPDGVCQQPPGPYYATEANLDFALTKTVGVFKGEASPKVIDTIPKSARGVQMIAYLSCKAQEKGLIKTNKELKEYTKLLGDIANGRTLTPSVEHEGLLGALVKNLVKTPEADFVLTIAPDFPELDHFDVGTLTAKTWRELVAKMCSKFHAELECTQIDAGARIEISKRMTAHPSDAGWTGELQPRIFVGRGLSCNVSVDSQRGNYRDGIWAVDVTVEGSKLGKRIMSIRPNSNPSPIEDVDTISFARSATYEKGLDIQFHVKWNCGN